jgi:threonine aldolase
VWRRRYGGAMRQAGVIAAAGLVALEQMVDRLAEDHAHARLLAEAAAQVHPGGIDPGHVETNIVAIEGLDAAAAVAGLAEHGVAAGAMDARTLRLVTHHDVDEDACRRAADALRRVLADVTGA